ncbi:hypothetical protein TNCV_276421 [Trichonephila clavipes]|nr:hypothetical protein TNCV_276421 [Trichonephila clavipes]
MMCPGRVAEVLRLSSVVIHAFLFERYLVGNEFVPLKHRGFADFPMTRGVIFSEPSMFTASKIVNFSLLCFPQWHFSFLNVNVFSSKHLKKSPVSSVLKMLRGSYSFIRSKSEFCHLEQTLMSTLELFPHMFLKTIPFLFLKFVSHPSQAENSIPNSLVNALAFSFNKEPPIGIFCPRHCLIDETKHCSRRGKLPLITRFLTLLEDALKIFSLFFRIVESELSGISNTLATSTFLSPSSTDSITFCF